MQISLHKIEKKFGHKMAVDGVDVEIHEGIHGLLGANGAGKTTLMRMLCGVLYPTSGEIFLDGRNIDDLGEQYRCTLGYLPQEFGYYPDFTAKEFMRYIATLKGIPKRKAKIRSEELLESVGLSEAANKKIYTFSGGMKQRLGIAQAVLNNPQILVLDEPTAGLDPRERVHFRNLVKDFAKDKIVIISTHIVSDLENIADNILLMKEGKIILQGSVDEMTEHVSGKVWKCCCARQDMDKYVGRYCITDKKDMGSMTELRIIGDEGPCTGAWKVEGSLEDVYMYYFQEETERRNINVWNDEI